MPQGLQAWDAAGNLVLDLPTRITRVLGSTVITAGSTGYITDAAFATGTIWWAVTAGTSVIGGYAPSMVAEPTNNRIAYSPKSSTDFTPVDVNVIYGVF